MACFSAGLGLLPAAIMNGIGAQAQQPLARVVVGGMITTVLAVLFLIPEYVSRTKSWKTRHIAEPKMDTLG